MEEFYQTTHLVQIERVRLAIDYLVHEFAKIVPSCNHQQLRDSLLQHAPAAASDDVRVRNFWNLFCAIASGYRVKDIHPFITAENFRWERRRVPLAALVPSQKDLGWLANVQPFSVALALAYLRGGKIDAATHETRLHRGKRHREDMEDPLIGIAQQDGILVLDGNGRLKARLAIVATRAQDDGSGEEIDVWVGTGTGEPRNYWIPTSGMFLLGHIIRDVDRIDNMLATASPLGAREFAERVLPHLPPYSERGAVVMNGPTHFQPFCEGNGEKKIAWKDALRAISRFVVCRVRSFCQFIL